MRSDGITVRILARAIDLYIDKAGAGRNLAGTGLMEAYCFLNKRFASTPGTSHVGPNHPKSISWKSTPG